MKPSAFVWKIFISPLFLNSIFVRYSILGWQFFSFEYTFPLSPDLWDFCWEICQYLYGGSFVSNELLFSCCFLDSLVVWFLTVLLKCVLERISLNSVCLVTINFMKWDMKISTPTWEVLNHYSFKLDFYLLLPLFFWNSNNLHIISFGCIP